MGEFLVFHLGSGVICMKVEVKSVELRELTGRKGSYWKQHGFVELVDRNGDYIETRRISFVVPTRNAAPVPYPPGDYVLSPSSFSVGQFGELVIRFVNLQPVASASRGS